MEKKFGISYLGKNLFNEYDTDVNFVINMKCASTYKGIEYVTYKKTSFELNDYWEYYIDRNHLRHADDSVSEMDEEVYIALQIQIENNNIN
jgi:hypothetical protein